MKESAQMVVDRIKEATRTSQLIVEKCHKGRIDGEFNLDENGDPLFNTSFANTVKGRIYLERPPEHFVGVYYGKHDGVNAFLEIALD